MSFSSSSSSSSGKTVAAVAIFAASAAVALAGGCGGSSSNGGASSGGSGSSGASSGASSGGAPDLQAACPDSAKQACDEYATCNAKSFRYPSLDACVTAQLSLCNLEGQPGILGAALSGSTLGINVDWSVYLDCMKRKAALGPSCKPPPNVTSDDVLAVRAACAPSKLIGPGTRAAGAGCYVEFQCAPGLACSANTTAGRDAGVCGACETIPEGTACQGSGDCGLLLGMECNATSKTCKRYAQTGESCADRACDPTAFSGCERTSKTCKPLARSGESCASIACDTALFLYCSTADQTCHPIPRNVGDACKPDQVCGGGLFCDQASYTCQALRGAGESCAAPDANACDANQGLACDPGTSTCVSPYGHPGDACADSGPTPRACWQSVCVQSAGTIQGTCVAYGVEGSACASSSTCAETYECNSGTCKSLADTIDGTDASIFADAAAAYAACQ